MGYYNSTDTCDRTKKDGKRCGRDFCGTALREYNNEEIWTGNWICNQCYHLLRTYDTTDINKIRQIKSENFFKGLEKEYGKEFANWARQNKTVPQKYLKAGCKNWREYRDKMARNRGLKDDNERRNLCNYKNNKRTPLPDNKDCASNLGVHIGENVFKIFLEKFFEEVSGSARCSHDGGIDFICKNPRKDFIEKYPHLKLKRNKEYKIQLKVRCLRYNHWDFLLYSRYSKDYIPDIDYFILCAFDNRDNLNPLHVWIFKNDNIVRGAKFIDRECFSVTNKSKYLLPFKRYDINEIGELKEILRGL